MSFEFVRSGFLDVHLAQAAPGLLALGVALSVNGLQTGLSSQVVPTLARTLTPAESSSQTDAFALIGQLEGFRNYAYWDVNAYRVGYGSDTITTAAGDIGWVTVYTTTTVPDAKRDLIRRVGEFQDVIRRQIGLDAWQRLGANTQASLTSVAYNYGSLPDSVVIAARTGDSAEIAIAICSLESNPERRFAEANNALYDSEIEMKVPLERFNANVTVGMDHTASASPTPQTTPLFGP